MCIIPNITGFKRYNKEIFMEYKVVGAMTSEALETLVNTLLKQGWKLQGGICYPSGYYNQAMIK